MCCRWIWASLACLTSVAGGWYVARQDPEEPLPSNRPFMQAKLEHAQGIVTGLALENYDLIAQAAQNLMLLSNESAWNVIQTGDYIEMSADFRGSAARLRDAARNRNIDGATIAWFEVTLNCVRCHKYLRQKTHSPPADR